MYQFMYRLQKPFTENEMKAIITQHQKQKDECDRLKYIEKNRMKENFKEKLESRRRSRLSSPSPTKPTVVDNKLDVKVIRQLFVENTRQYGHVNLTLPSLTIKLFFYCTDFMISPELGAIQCFEMNKTLESVVNTMNLEG